MIRVSAGLVAAAALMAAATPAHSVCTVARNTVTIEPNPDFAARQISLSAQWYVNGPSGWTVIDTSKPWVRNPPFRKPLVMEFRVTPGGLQNLLPAVGSVPGLASATFSTMPARLDLAQIAGDAMAAFAQPNSICDPQVRESGTVAVDVAMRFAINPVEIPGADPRLPSDGALSSQSNIVVVTPVATVVRLPSK